MSRELRQTPVAHPDLIASGKLDTSAVLLHMSRRHAAVLGAWLDGRAEIARGQLPREVMEVLEALTVRLIAPPGARWNDLRKILDGEPARVELMNWVSNGSEVPPQAQAGTPVAEYTERFKAEQEAIARQGYTGRRRRAYDGGPNGEDLNLALLGDADGTTVEEMFGKEEK